MGPKRTSHKAKLVSKVIMLAPKQCWAIWWGSIGKCSTHSAKTLSVDKHLVSNVPIDPACAPDLIQNHFAQDPLVKWTDVTTALPSANNKPTSGLTASADCSAVAREAEVPASVAKNPGKSKAIDKENQGNDDNPDNVEFEVDAPNLEAVTHESTGSHSQQSQNCLCKKSGLTGRKVVTKSGKSRQRRTEWTVMGDINKADVQGNMESSQVGASGFSFTHKPERSGERQTKARVNFLELLIHLWPSNCNKQLNSASKQILVRDCKQRQMGSAARKKAVKLISKSEFWAFWELLLLQERVGGAWTTCGRSVRLMALVCKADMRKRMTEAF